MTTLYSLEKLHKELEVVISSDLAKFRRHMPGGFGISYGARSQLKGKCKREHGFLKTFVPLNRSLDKYLQQASVASMHDIDLSRTRCSQSCSKILHRQPAGLPEALIEKRASGLAFFLKGCLKHAISVIALLLRTPSLHPVLSKAP